MSNAVRLVLTDATVIRPIAGKAFVAVYEGTATATILRANAENVWPCNWLCEAGYDEDGGRIIRECGALCVGFDNGVACANGHSHFSYAEYFDDEEIEMNRQHGHTLPANARSIDGGLLNEPRVNGVPLSQATGFDHSASRFD